MVRGDSSAASGGWPPGEPEGMLREMERIALEAGWGSLGLVKMYEEIRNPPDPAIAPDPTAEITALGFAIRLTRVERGISQVQLAKITGFAQGWISNVERGQCDPSWANVVRLAEGLGVPLGEVVEVAESLVEQYGSGPYEALDFTRSR